MRFSKLTFYASFDPVRSEASCLPGCWEATLDQSPSILSCICLVQYPRSIACGISCIAALHLPNCFELSIITKTWCIISIIRGLFMRQLFCNVGVAINFLHDLLLWQVTARFENTTCVHPSRWGIVCLFLLYPKAIARAKGRPRRISAVRWQYPKELKDLVVIAEYLKNSAAQGNMFASFSKKLQS